MNHRQPPPPPHQHNTILPPSRHLPSRGETDISYDAYSPSPSSLSAHRNKYKRIQDWAIYNTLNRPRIGGSGMIHDPSMGLGSASWSDTGTGITEEVSDLGTVPTTVKDARGGNGPREKVDVRKAMSATRAKEAKGVQRKPSRLREELDVSELPYRQLSIRRDAVLPANGSAPDKHDKSNSPATAPKRPMLHHSKTTKPAPSPALAKPPTPPKDRITPGAIFVTSPESDNGKDNTKARVMSPYAIREAYLESALTLPIDMLSQVQRDKHLQTPAPTLKGAKSAISISSGVTITRLASLLGKGSPKDEDKQLGNDVRQLGSSKTVGVKPSRTPVAIVDKVDSVPKAKSTQAKSRLSTANMQEIPRSLGSAPALGRSTTVPANSKKAQPTPITAPISKPSNLGLDLGPVINAEPRPAPHRQLSALRRPALTPGSSAENLLAPTPNTLGRRSRDPSMTDLKTRFEPATYPLPESKSSVGTRRTEVTDEEVSGNKGKKGKKGAEGILADVREKKQGQVVQDEPKAEVEVVETPPPVVRQSTPRKPKRPVEPTPPLVSHETFIPPTSPDFILTPPAPNPLPLDRHTLPRGISSRVAHDDRVSFEVPNGTRGRLRVSLAWVRDRATRSNTLTPSDAPPPLPPKSPPTRHHSRNREKHHEKEVKRPSPFPSVTTSPPRSPKQQQAQVYHDPSYAQATRPPYPQVGMNGFPQVPGPGTGPGRPFPYPQPQPWASMPHLAQQQQMQMQIPPRYAPHLAQSAESFEPPSARHSPDLGMMSLPNVGMGMGMGMGMPMGMGQQGYGQAQAQGQGQGQGRSQMGMGIQNGINPYSNLSLGQHQHLQSQNPNQNQNQGWQDHDQHHQCQDHNLNGYGQGQGQGQGPSRNPYSFGNRNNGQDGNRQSIWKRMFNGNFNNAGNQGNGNGYRVQRNAQGQYEQRDAYAQTQNQNQNQNYDRQRGSDRIGRWMRNVTPGKRPPGDGSGLNMDVRDRKNYNLTQPIFGRRRQYDGPINDETVPRNRGDTQLGGGRQGGMMNWLSTLQGPGNGKRLQGRRNQYGEDHYQTNRPRQNLYGNDPFQSDRDAKRRQKMERRNERDDRVRRQVQAQAQGRRGQRKWKDRLPRKNTRVRARQDTYAQRQGQRQGQGQGRGTTGMGVFGNLFR